MKNGKEVRQKQSPKKDPTLAGFDSDDSAFINLLSLSAEIKQHLTSQGYKWRFINAAQFRGKGFHRSRWVPYKFPVELRESFGANAEGIIQREDLILAIRTAEVDARMRAAQKQINDRYQDTNASQAKELKKQLRNNGIDSKVSEGYDEGAGYNEAE